MFHDFCYKSLEGVLWGEAEYAQRKSFCSRFKLELNPRGQVAPQVYVDNCDATN